MMGSTFNMTFCQGICSLVGVIITVGDIKKLAIVVSVIFIEDIVVEVVVGVFRSGRCRRICSGYRYCYFSAFHEFTCAIRVGIGDHQDNVLVFGMHIL